MAAADASCPAGAGADADAVDTADAVGAASVYDSSITATVRYGDSDHVWSGIPH